VKGLSRSFGRLYVAWVRPSIASEVLKQARSNHLLSDKRFSVDETLIEASGESEEYSTQRSRSHAASGGSPQSGHRVSRGKASQRHACLHDRSGSNAATKKWRSRVEAGLLRPRTDGLVVDTELCRCSGTSERDAVPELAGRIAGDQRVTVGADKGAMTQEDSCRKCAVSIEWPGASAPCRPSRSVFNLSLSPVQEQAHCATSGVHRRQQRGIRFSLDRDGMGMRYSNPCVRSHINVTPRKSARFNR